MPTVVFQRFGVEEANRFKLTSEPNSTNNVRPRLEGGNLSPQLSGNGADFFARGYVGLHSIGAETTRMYVTKTQDNLATGTSHNDLDDGSPVAMSLNSFGTAAQGDYVYVGCDRPFRALYATVGNTNSNANNLEVSVYTGTWDAVTTLTDGTDTGASLAQSGYISWSQGGTTAVGTWVTGRLTDIASAAADVPNATVPLYWARLSWSAALDASVTLTNLRIAEELAINVFDMVVAGWRLARATTGAYAGGVDYTCIIGNGEAFDHTSPLFYNAFNMTYSGTGTIDCTSDAIPTFFAANAVGFWNTSTGTIKRPQAQIIISPNNVGTVQDNAGLDIMDQSSGGGGTYSGTGNYATTVGAVGAGIRIRKQTSLVLMSFVDPNVAHGATGVLGTMEYGQILQSAAGTGGVTFRSAVDGTAVVSMQFQAISSTTENATRTTGGLAPFRFQAYKYDGATSVAALAADKNTVVFQNGTTTTHIFDSDGDSFQDVGTAWTNFDDQEDWQMARGLVASIRPPGDPLRARHADLVDRFRPVLAANKLITYNDGEGQDGHHFMSMRRTLLFTLDMGFQIGERIWGPDGLASQVAELRGQLTEANRKLALLGG